MNLTSKQVVVYIALIAMFLIGGYVLSTAQASAPPGANASVATSSLVAVGTTAVTIEATSSCTARIITTVAQPIMLTFSDYLGQSPSGTFGHLQAASTTVAYDSGLYGCGLIKAIGFNAATNITYTRAN